MGLAAGLYVNNVAAPLDSAMRAPRPLAFDKNDVLSVGHNVHINGRAVDKVPSRLICPPTVTSLLQSKTGFGEAGIDARIVFVIQ